MFLFYLRLLSERVGQDIIINVHTCACKVRVILVICEWNLKFIDRFSKSSQISNFTKICPVGGEFLANRRTWRSQYSLFAISWMRLKSRPHICGDWSFHCLLLATWWTLDFCLTHSTVHELLYWTPTVKICPIVGWGDDWAGNSYFIPAVVFSFNPLWPTSPSGIG